MRLSSAILFRGDEAGKSSAFQEKSADAGADHARCDHDDVAAGIYGQLLVEVIVAAGDDDAAAFSEVRREVVVEDGGLELIGDEEEENISDRGCVGKIICILHSVRFRRLGIFIAGVCDKDFWGSGE